MPQAVALVAAVVGAAGSAKQAKETRGAARDQKKAEQTKQRIRDLQTARERRAQIAEARKARANVVVGAERAGTTGTSSFATGTGSISSKAGSNISFLDNVQGLSQQASIFNISAADKRGSAAKAGAISGVASSLFKQAGGFDTLDTTFRQFGNPDKLFS